MYANQNTNQTYIVPTQGRSQYSSGSYGEHPYQNNHPSVYGISESNQLVKFSTPLITLITQIRHTIDHQNVPGLRAQVIEEIKNFERKMTSIHYPVRTIVAARYCLCAAIDESVLSRPWGTNSPWVQGSLLSIFQKETWGGERFYLILEDMLRDMRQNIDFIELVYFLLSLGFEGKFFGDQNRAAREEIRNRIFYHIRHARAKPERSLSPAWKNLKLPKSTTERKNNLKKTWIVTAVFLLVIGAYFNFRTHHVADKTLQKLDGIAQVSPITTFSQVIQRPVILRNENE